MCVRVCVCVCVCVCVSVVVVVVVVGGGGFLLLLLFATFLLPSRFGLFDENSRRIRNESCFFFFFVKYLF